MARITELRFAYPRDNRATAVGLATFDIKTQSEISHVDAVCLVLWQSVMGLDDCESNFSHFLLLIFSDFSDSCTRFSGSGVCH